MPVVEATIKQDIVSFIKELNSNKEEDLDTAIDEFADKLAKTIKDAILSATVQAGIPVATAGSATAQTGVTTGTGTLL